MKKRVLAILLAVSLAFSLLPTAYAADITEDVPVCVCAEVCTEEHVNADCPVCGAEGAAVERCGRYIAPAEAEAARPTDEGQPENGAPDADKPEEPAVQSVDQGIAVQADAHNHCFCGGSVTVGDHTSHSDVTYTAWNGTSGISYTNNTAYVYLTGNATISSHLTVDGKTLYLCLNGKTLSSSGKAKIQVKNGGRLVLCDCQGGGTFKGATQSVWGGACVYLYTSRLDMFGGKLTGGKVTGKGGGGAIALDDHQCAFNMYGGEISGNDGNKAGGAIFRTFGSGVNQPGGTFNMYGGTIKDNKAQNGGAFYSVTAGTVNLAGGTISGNQSTSTTNNDYTGGGAIYMRGGGTLTISGTQITGNSAKKDGGAIFTGCGNVTISGSASISNNTAGRRGGAICLYSDTGLDAKLSMTGGTISGNSATNDGGGVYVGKKCTLTLGGSAAFTGNKAKWGGAIYLTDNSSMTMTSGTLTQNNASEQGGGVFSYSDSSNCNLSGGTLEGNTAGKNGGAVYINKGALKLSGSPVVKDNTVSGRADNVELNSDKTLTISGAMSTGASIGITTANTSYPVAFSGAYAADYAKYFFSDDANAHVEYKDDQKLYLVANVAAKTLTVKFYANGGTGAPDDMLVQEKGGVFTFTIPTTVPTRDGYHFKCWSEAQDTLLSGYKSGDQVMIRANGSTEKTLYAFWEAHSGGTATCTEKAVCSTCDQEYGDVDANNHDWGAWTSNGDDTHTRTCSRDKSHTENGNCSGGTPTCTERAVCKDCKAAYGSVLGHVWGEPSYTWTAVPDGYMCVASSKCKNCDFDVADVAAVTYAVTKMPTCLEEGTGTYTAAFSSAFGFPAQTKEVTLPATGHDWADATCTMPKTCKVCKVTEGDAAGHTGGKANCHTKAVCEVCQQAYGEFDAANHDGGTELRNKKDATCTEKGYTGDTYCLGCSTVIKAGAEIDVSGHDWGAWTSNGDGTHTRTCSRDKSHTENGKCSGGTADCCHKAKCGICKGEYGALAPDDHTDLKHFPAKKATTKAEGNIEYWYCSGCGKYYRDAAATDEITQADTVIAKRRPSGGTPYDPDVYKELMDGKDGKNTLSGVKSSNTGDPGVALYAGMALLSLTGGAWVVSKKRK